MRKALTFDRTGAEDKMVGWINCEGASLMKRGFNTKYYTSFTIHFYCDLRAKVAYELRLRLRFS